MRKVLSRPAYLLLVPAIFVVGFFVVFSILSTKPVLADNGGIIVNVKQELGTNLAGVTVDIMCTGGVLTNLGTTDGSGNVTVLLGALPAGADCGNGEPIDVRVVKDGYVGQTFIALGTYVTGAQNTFNATGVQFSHKVTVKDELNSALIPTTVTAGATSTACTLAGNVAYCPVILADDDTVVNGFIAVKDGYVTNSAASVPLASNRTAGTDAQAAVVMDATNGLDFSHKIVVKNELNAALTPDTAAAGASLVGCTVSTNNVYCPVVLADDDTVANGFVVVKDGYVTNAAASAPLAGNRTANADAQQVTTMDATNGLDFSHKIVVKNELNAALTPDSATAGANDTVCTVSTNSVYCPVPLADDNVLDATTAYSVVKDGYVTATPFLAGSRATGTAAQELVTMNGASGLDFSYKITAISSEALATDLTATVTTLEVGDATGRNACALSGGAWYCPVVLANSNGTMISRVAQDGYVEKINYATLVGTTRASNATAQVSDTIIGIQYAIKVIVTNSSSGFGVNGATVTAGDGGAVTCVESGSTAVYYCSIPLADVNATVNIVKANYNNGSNTFVDRATSTDIQVIVSVSMSATGSSNEGGGGGGGGTTGGATGYATVPAVVPAEVPTGNDPASIILKTDIVSVIDREKVMVAAEANPESYFIMTGTDSTHGLGSGERAAAISSYKEAYGRAPATISDWQDVLNIANGRWPIGVIKAVEARAYTNFKLVYGRNANMKNSTDVNALKMMGYGVRSTMARNLKAEAAAIVRFKATFGFNPTTARHWNIMRAIAYSGAK